MKRLILELNLAFILLLNASTTPAQNDVQNTFSIKLNVPVIIDEEIKTEYIPEKMQDKLQEFNDKKSYLTIRVNNSVLQHAYNGFWGTYQNQYFPFETITIKGQISEDHMNLKYIDIQKELRTKTDYRREEEFIKLKLENVPLFNGICFFNKSISTVKLIEYEFKITEISKDYYERTHLKRFKSIDYDVIPDNPKLARGKFTIDLKIDGAPESFIVETEKIRGQDISWEPPISEIVGKQKAFTPNAIALYFDEREFEERNNKNFIEFFEDLLFSEEIIYAEPELIVCERRLLKYILQELALNQTELVDHNMQVNSDITKEQFAIFVSGDVSKKSIKLQLYSKMGAARISAFNLSEENLPFAVHEIYNKLRHEIKLMKS